MLTSDKQLEFYRENGYLIIENVLSEERLKRIRDAAEERLLFEGDQAGAEGAEHGLLVRRLCNLFSKGRVWEELAVEPIALEAAQLTIGDDCRWQAMNFHDPVPGEGDAHQSIHADRSFFPKSIGYITVIFSFDDMTVENGATRIVPGSHKGPWPREVLNTEEAYEVIEGEIYAVCPAGSAIFVHGDVWHSGRANYSQSTRRALHLGFSCPNAAPQYEIAGNLTGEMRSRLGDHCKLIPDTLDQFGLEDLPYYYRVSAASGEDNFINSVIDGADISKVNRDN